jgi:hypothetical protein
MYYKLFNKITDVIEELKKAQQETEEMFAAYEDKTPDNILHIPPRGGEKGEKPPEE